MAFRLTSYTEVPYDLYVERRADAQLHSIIEAMQRPGYVLVPRQTGKTNLLLRAKRRWEDENDLYVYIDLSTLCETEIGCFQALIDIAIDTHESILGPVKEKIDSLRLNNVSKSPVQAHNEELRELLKVTPRKLVFILDEIDAVTRTGFSDNFFSQIRSTYFSRINYPVLKKLTYVLSGVVEPSEIIKNPKISPFNIGEKIYLDDFTRNEFDVFIEKAGLSFLGEDVINRIYEWTGGNPRMTWDVCYKLQTMEYHIPDSVDIIVKKMYLTAYDQPPIDTIRSLVKEDHEIRKAVIQLVHGNSEAISDKMKSKLYLYGIVNYYDTDVRIKNQIIRKSLSLSWLQKLEEEDKGLLANAQELYRKRLYKECADRFDLFLRNNDDFPEDEAPLCYFYMGACHFHLKSFVTSVQYLSEKQLDAQSSPKYYRLEQFILGEDCLMIGKWDSKALGHFNNAMKSGNVHDEVFYWSKLGSLIARQRLAKDDNNELQSVMSEYELLCVTSDLPATRSVNMQAAYQLAEYYRDKDVKVASQYYDLSLSFASESDKLRILSEKLRVVTEENRPALLMALVDATENVDTLVDVFDPKTVLGADAEVLARALAIIYSYAFSDWGAVRGKLKLLADSEGDALFFVFQQLTHNPSLLPGDSAKNLIKDLYGKLSDPGFRISPENRLAVFKYNAFFNDSESSAKEYIQALKDSNEGLDSIGLVVVKRYSWQLFVSKSYNRILKELGWIPERYPVRFSPEDTLSRLNIELALMVSYAALPDNNQVLEKADFILSSLKSLVIDETDANRRNLTQLKYTAQYYKDQIEASGNAPIKIDLS